MLELETPPSQNARRNGKSLTLLPIGSKNEALDMNHLAAELVGLFKLLADDTRMRILLALMQDEELHVRALCGLLGQSQPAVSHHLALMRVAGLIDRRREGKHNYYRLIPGRFQQLLDLIFSGVDPEERQIRFRDYVLSFAPA